MTAHTCRTLVDGCYRCDLNRDEMNPAFEVARVELTSGPPFTFSQVWYSEAAPTEAKPGDMWTSSQGKFVLTNDGWRRTQS